MIVLEEEEDNTSLIEWNNINKNVLDKLINKSQNNYLRINSKLEYNDEFRLHFFNKISSTVTPWQFSQIDFNKLSKQSSIDEVESKLQSGSSRDQINSRSTDWMHSSNIFEVTLDNIKTFVSDKELTGIQLQSSLLAEVSEKD